MGFSSDLLDGFDVLYRRTEGVLKVSQDMATFFKKLAIIEADHAKLLSRLASNYGQKKLLSNPHIDGTVRDSWVVIIKSVDTIGTKLETYAHSLMKEVSMEMSDFVKDKENHRKKLTNDGQKLTKEMKAQLETLTKVRGNYIKASKDSEAAMVSLNREQSGANQAKKISQLQSKASQAAEKAAASDQEYKDVLKQTNSKQQDFYHTEMPNLLNEFQQFEEERITFTKTLLSRYGSLITEIPPVMEESASNTSQSANKIDHAFDVDKFIDENKTGVTPPPPMEYQPYEMSASNLSAPLSNNSTIGTSPNKGSFIGRPGSQKEWGLTAGDDNLTVEEKRQKLEQQITELDGQIRSESTAKNGVEKLIQFYASDPTSQRKAEAELAEAERKIKSLQESKRIVKSQLVELNGGGSVEDEDEEDGHGHEHAHAHPANGGPAQIAASPRHSVMNGGEERVLVRVRGLFDYEATCDTELSFKEGDILQITEQDESGWWYAEVDGRAGFVPQNYVEVLE